MNKGMKLFGAGLIVGGILGCLKALFLVFVLHRKGRLTPVLEYADQRFEEMKECCSDEETAKEYHSGSIFGNSGYVRCVPPVEVDMIVVEEVPTETFED